MATQQTAIVKRPVMELINASKTQLEGRLPNGMTSERFMYGLATAVQKNPALQNCEPRSVMLAAYEAAEVGCNLSPSLALGWLIPYGKEAQFQPSYRFFIQKAYETGAVAAFYAEVVYENDLFCREFAPKRTLKHMPPTDNADRGQPIGAYALIEMRDGRLDFEYLTAEQIKRHQAASKMANSLMWTKFWEEGWRKTPIRVLFKRLPLTNPELEKLAETVSRDAEREADPVIPGHMEVEEVTSIAEAAAAGRTETHAPQAIGTGTVYYHQGKMLTTISDATGTVKPADLKQFGLRIGEDKKWTIPASLTREFVEWAGKKRLQAIEVDENGRSMGQAETATDDWLPPSMFEEEAR